MESKGLEPVIRLLGIEEYRLPNGLRVVLAPDPAKPTFTINLTVLVGSIHEGAGEAGMAHVFEHLLFHSLEGFPDVKETFKALGTQCNGTTSFDRTNFFATISSSDENLETAIRIEAARLGRAVLHEEDLVKEGKIVESEFELRATHPQGLMIRGMLGCMFDFHAYSREPIGTVEDFKSLKMANIRDFYRRYYTPDNAVLFLTGKFDPVKALSLVETHFGELKASGYGKPAYTTREPGSQGERRYMVRAAGDAFHVMVGYRIPGATSQAMAAADTLATALASNRIGPLHDALVGKGLASEAYIFALDLRMPSPWVALAEVPLGKDPAAAEAALVEAVERGAALLTQADLDRAKGVIERYRDQLMNSPEELADKLSQFEAGGSWTLLIVRCELIKTLTLDDLRTFASRYIRRENRVVGRFEPDPNGVVVMPDPEPDMAQYAGLLSKIPATVKATKEFSYTPASLQQALTWVTIGPARIGLISKETKGADVFISFRLPFPSRAVVSPSYSTGLALGALMTKRTEALTKEQLEGVLAESNSSIGAVVLREQAIVAVKTKRNKLETILPLAFEMMRHPFIQEQEVRDYVTRKEGELKAIRDNPSLLLGMEINRGLFPDGDPRRTRTAEQQIEDLRGLTTGSILAFHKDFFGADGIVGSVVGELTPDEARAMLSPLVAEGWKAAIPFVRESNDPVEGIGAREVRVATPGKPTVFSTIFQPMELSMKSPDYMAMEAATWTLFQDPLGSRISKKVREEAALSYAVQGQSNCSIDGDFAYWLVLMVTNPQNSVKAMEFARAEFEKALRDGLGQEEIEAFKKAQKNRMAVMRSDDNIIAGMITEFGWNSLDFNYWAALDRDLESLTAQHVNDVMRRHIQPAKMGLILVGDLPVGESSEDR
jgi:zinc protease